MPKEVGSVDEDLNLRQCYQQSYTPKGVVRPQSGP